MGRTDHTHDKWTWIGIALASVLWWSIAGQRNGQRFVLLVAASLGAFAIGCAAGFLFSSYGDETNTIGKVRDWLIGGITGLTLAKVQSGALQRLLTPFCVSGSSSEYALVLSMVVTFTGVGFFFMFFQRELIVNVLLAQSRAERGRIEGTVQTGVIIGSISRQLPTKLMSGVQDAEEVLDAAEVKSLHDSLFSPDVDEFLKNVEDAQSKGASLDWDVVSKTAYVYYYRSYFDESQRDAYVAKALPWITRALVQNPTHVDMAMKQADMLSAAGDDDGAISVLQALVRRPEAPVVVKQWLGHFMVFRPELLHDAIRYSKEYLEEFPHDADGWANLAAAYARLYALELRELGKEHDFESEKRRCAIEAFRRAIECDPDYRDYARTKLMEPGKSFEVFKNDREFNALLAVQKQTTTAG